jgi:hypothetical protein
MELIAPYRIMSQEKPEVIVTVAPKLGLPSLMHWYILHDIEENAA